MENPNNFGRNGGNKFPFPIGFRFRPTDEELVVHYLKPKVHSLPLPASVIPDLHVFHTNPWDLPGDLREKRYFFSKRERNINKRKRISNTGSGYWKAMGKEKYIKVGSNKKFDGVKQSLVFYGLRGLRTSWVMHEFCLVGSETTPNTTQKLLKGMQEWVVCCIYQRRKSRKSGGKSDISNGNKNRNVVGKIRTSIIETSSNSSCSSEITEVSCEGSDHEEATSATIFSSHFP